MTRTPPKAFTMGYAAPCGRTVPFKLARLADGSHVFLFLEIALSLGYENPAKMVPDCDAAHALRMPFANLPRARRCVTLDGLFTCTRLSRTDNPLEPAPSPASHFHGWLRAVILPMTASSDWPVPSLHQAELQRDWKKAHRDRLTEEILLLEDWIAMERGDVRTRAERMRQPGAVDVTDEAYRAPWYRAGVPLNTRDGVSAAIDDALKV
jgi:hypothetical protein